MPLCIADGTNIKLVSSTCRLLVRLNMNMHSALAYTQTGVEYTLQLVSVCFCVSGVPAPNCHLPCLRPIQNYPCIVATSFTATSLLQPLLLQPLSLHRGPSKQYTGPAVPPANTSLCYFLPSCAVAVTTDWHVQLVPGPLLPASPRPNGEAGLPQQRSPPGHFQHQKHTSICSRAGARCGSHLSVCDGDLCSGGVPQGRQRQ